MQAGVPQIQPQGTEKLAAPIVFRPLRTKLGVVGHPRSKIRLAEEIDRAPGTAVVSCVDFEHTIFAGCITDLN